MLVMLFSQKDNHTPGLELQGSQEQEVKFQDQIF